MFEQTADGMSPADADFYRQNVLPNLITQIDTQIEGFRQQYDAEMRVPRMRADVETQRRAVETARGTAEEQLRRTVQKRSGEVAMGEGAETSVPQAVEELVIDLESPKNKQLFADLQQATKGTALENNKPQQEKLFREMVRSRNNDLVSLIDDNAIEKTIDSIEKSMLDNQKFSIDDRDILRKRLKEVGLQARAGVEGEIGNAPPIVSMKLTQAVSDLKKNYFGRVNTDNYTLEQFVKAGTKGSEITPQRVLLRNYLGEMETGLKRKAVQGTTEPFFERGADEDFHRNFLQESFLQNPNEMPNLIGISPAEAIKIIDNEIANPRDYGNGVARVGQGGTFIGEEGYQPYLRKLKEHISNFKADPRTGGFIPSSLAELPQGTEFNLETAVKEPNKVAEIVGLLKRGMTTYNPSVLVGNYMGNALVEAMNTGRNPMSILTTQIADTFNFARRVKQQVSGKQPLSLTDDLTLRAVPREAITQLVETGGELSWFERNKFAKGIRDAYQAGDTVPKTAEALKVSTDVVGRLQATKPNDVIAMRFTPTDNVLVQNNGNGQFAIIDQKSGRLITSGTLESSNVKRVLGQVVKNGVDAKFPDVREIPAWYRQAMNPKNKMLQVGSLIWSMPFMSYVLKAADSPFRRGILGNTLLMDTNPILYETTGGARATLDNAINGFLTPYLRSRGLVNQMSKRIDGLSQEEADELRKLYSFAPNRVKPTILGTLYNLTDDSSARNIISPSWATYWSMTDTYVRALPGLMNTARGLVSKDPEAKTFTEDKLNIELEKLMMKDQPTVKDTLDASGVAFGLLYPAFQKIEEATQYGKSPLKVDDIAGLLGVVGRVGVDVAEKEGWKEPKTNTIRAEKSKDFKEGLVLTALEMFAGSQFGNTIIPEAKMASLVNGLYNEVWNNVIQKQQDKSDRLRAEGNEDEADNLLDETEELNDKVIQLLQAKVENYLKVLKKVGIKTEMDETSKRFKWKKVKEKPDTQYVPQIKEEETYEPTLETPSEPPTFPQREEENE